jgi:UDP-N-acetylglucosamine 2-epimerase (non-hydrolysing)
MPDPDCNLGVGSGTHTHQTSAVMQAFEPVLQERKPDLVLVYGDVNSTLAAALVCSKLGVHVGHVEAGLRSRDRSMPEEINRLLTDQLSDLLFTPSADGDENLLREGIGSSKIHRVGKRDDRFPRSPHRQCRQIFPRRRDSALRTGHAAPPFERG